MDALRLDNVSKCFSIVKAVDEVTVRVPAGCIYGFLGPNGAGKTTTLRMIMDIFRPDSGNIKVLGLAPSRARSRVGYLPEERGLYRKMTVAKMLEYFGTLKGLSAAESRRRTAEWLEKIELSASAHRKVEELSRGMHQKAQFAAACIHDPDLLILDEPFSGLDPVNLDLLKNFILEQRRKGKTIVFSTHGMHDAEELCDFFLLINRGRVVFDGTLEQVRTKWPMSGILAEVDGDAEFVRTLPNVKDVQQENGRMDINLAEGADPQDILTALVGRGVRVRSFQVKRPTLHEFFVRMVGEEK
jgi:ABC-2 type transport system ATP-binding protein